MRRTLVGAAFVTLAALPLVATSEIAEERALDLSVAYTADVWVNLKGGRETGTAYLDNLDVVLEADLETLLGWSDTRAVLYGLYNNGSTFSASHVGDAQAISNIETGVEAARLFEAYVETAVGERGTILVGLYDLNSEFDALETSGLFLHSAHGIGTDIAQSGVAGPSIFPLSSLAMRLEWRWNEQLLTRLAVLDAVPGGPWHPHTSTELSSEEGALVVAELERRFGAAKLLAGAWRYTAAFQDQLASARAAQPVERRGNHGAYLRGEWRAGEAAPLALFARLGWAAPEFNPFEWFLSFGAVLDGPFDRRPDDKLGLAVAWAEAADPYRAASALSDVMLDHREVALELTYQVAVTERVSIQPDLQYIVNPGLAVGRGNNWSAGIRVAITLL